jgi:hypothetical protein
VRISVKLDVLPYPSVEGYTRAYQPVVCIYLLAQNSVSFIPLIAVENVLSFLPSELQFMSFQLACQKLEPIRTAFFTFMVPCIINHKIE